MKLDNIKRDINSTAKSEIKEVRSENNNKLNIILNPLQGVDIKSDIYSFNELKSVKENFDNYMKSCENYMFYFLHQSFMCDEEHKKFFKSMVGRFYDLPERFWKYYWMEALEDSKGEYYLSFELNENFNIYSKINNGGYPSIERELNKYFGFPDQTKWQFNEDAICLFWGTLNENRSDYQYYLDKGYKFYELYRFRTSLYKISNGRIFYKTNYWNLDFSDLKDFSICLADFRELRYNNAAFAYWGLENVEEFCKLYNKCIEINNWDIPKINIPIEISENDIKIIRSISQTYNWTADYIINNYELFDLDILSLNMSVPWDIELVKFFINKGYGHRMAQNKAVFDKVFLPILNDNIIEKIFRLEYEYYTR